MTNKYVLCSTLVLAMGNFAFADITYGGDGCPAGTAQISYGSNGAISLVLDSFDAAVDATTALRRSCNIALPIEVPPGYSVNFGTVRLLGSFDVAKGATATLSAEAFLAGSAGPQYNSTFNGDSAGPINLEFLPNVVWSPCGTSPNLRLNTSVLVKSTKTGQGLSQIKIDEIVLGKPIMRKCS